jgi:hypothetical protein
MKFKLPIRRTALIAIPKADTVIQIQPIEALRGTEKILKAALRAAFKIFSGF